MKFYVLAIPKAECGNVPTNFVSVDGSPTDDAPRCDICGKFRGMRPLLLPIHLEINTLGPRWGDVAFGSGDQIVISEKLKRLYTDNSMTGFSGFDPVMIARKNCHSTDAGSPPKYWLASIHRSRAAIDDTASGLVRDGSPVCEECRLGGIIKRTARVVLEPGSWTGEDIFIARGLPGTILVSDGFKQLFESNSLVGSEFVATESYHFDYYPHEHKPQKGGR
jgi:hypothetical protein